MKVSGVVFGINGGSVEAPFDVCPKDKCRLPTIPHPAFYMGKP